MIYPKGGETELPRERCPVYVLQLFNVSELSLCLMSEVPLACDAVAVAVIPVKLGYLTAG